MHKMYPFSKILYKDNDTPGWNFAFIGGDEKYVEKKCKELWKTYKIFSGNSFIFPIGLEYPINPDPEETHLTSSWVYSSELDKWFLPEETIPVPMNECVHPAFFEINAELDDLNDISWLKEIYLENIELFNRDAVKVTFHVTVKAEKQQTTIHLQYSQYEYELFKEFLEKVKANQFSYAKIEEYTYIKILSWPVGNDCRLIFQNYSYHDYVREPISTVIDKNLFVKVFEKFLNQIDSQYRELDKAVRAACKESEIKKE